MIIKPLTLTRVDSRFFCSRRNRALLVPAADTTHHPVGALVEAIRLAAANPGSTLLFAGHASPTGSAKANDKLSQQRADCARAVVMNDTQARVQIAIHAGGIDDIKAYLNYLHHQLAWPCAPGPINLSTGPATRAAVRGFQARFNLEFAGTLKENGVCGAKTLAAIFHTQRSEFDWLMERYGLTAADIRLHPSSGLACGARFASATLLPQPEPNPNRRFVAVLVVPGSASQTTLTAAGLYEELHLRLKTFVIDPEPLPGDHIAELAIRLHDEDAAVLAHTLCRVSVGDKVLFADRSDANGFVRCALPTFCPEFIAVSWDAPARIRPLLVPNMLHVRLSAIVQELLDLDDKFAIRALVPDLVELTLMREIEWDGHFLVSRDDLRTHASADFDGLGEFMAPGSSIVFDGCEVGQGSAGKSFLDEIGAIFFGQRKFGFLKANTKVTSTMFPDAVSLPDAAPITRRWPDDF